MKYFKRFLFICGLAGLFSAICALGYFLTTSNLMPYIEIKNKLWALFVFFSLIVGFVSTLFVYLRDVRNESVKQFENERFLRKNK